MCSRDAASALAAVLLSARFRCDPQSSVLTPRVSPRPPQALGAEVSASGCALEAMERVNEARGGTPPAPTPALTDLPQEVLHPLLSQLVKQPFFRYFRVNLQGRCPFWAEDGMCALPDCSVCECPADEVPLPWRVEAPPSLEVEAPMGGPLTPQTAECVGESGGEEGEASARLNAVEGLVNREGLDTRTLRVWGAADNPWTLEDERKVEEDPGCAYVNLLLNPERYTGYSGEHAHRVWGAIYAQACFNGLGTRGSSLCGGGPASEAPEPRVFYRLVSGLHASISAHIAGEYLLQRRGASEVWGPNYALFQERLGEHPERLQNLRFITAFVLRAVAQARPFLLAADYSTGFPVDDAATRALLRQLLDSPALRPSCAVPFDETRMFTGKQGPRLKEEVQLHFRNISAVMDCVGCEKCRLWGKLQTLGLGTAMKVRARGAAACALC